MFKDLSGDLQRGILLEANIRYQGHMLSKYRKFPDDEEYKNKYIQKTCEALVDKAKYYSEIESNMFYLNPFKKDRIQYVKNKALEYAKKLDYQFVLFAKSMPNTIKDNF